MSSHRESSYSVFSKPAGRSSGLFTQWNFQSPLSERKKGEASRFPLVAVSMSAKGINVQCAGCLLRPITDGSSQSRASWGGVAWANETRRAERRSSSRVVFIGSKGSCRGRFEAAMLW